MDPSTKNPQGPLSQLDRPSQDRFQIRIQAPGLTPAPNPAPKGNPCSESSSQGSTSAPGLVPKIDWSLDHRSQALLEVGIQLPSLIPARNPAPRLDFRSEFSSRTDSGSRQIPSPTLGFGGTGPNSSQCPRHQVEFVPVPSGLLRIPAISRISWAQALPGAPRDEG